MPELQLLRADHAGPILAFELANRAYFAGFISDRGDEYFQQFADRCDALLADQASGAAPITCSSTTVARCWAAST